MRTEAGVDGTVRRGRKTKPTASPGG